MIYMESYKQLNTLFLILLNFVKNKEDKIAVYDRLIYILKKESFFN